MESGRLNDERWKSMPFVEQMANIGSEVGRTAKWYVQILHTPLLLFTGIFG